MEAGGQLGGARERLTGERAYAPDPLRDWLRMLGGVAFALGALVLFLRKAGGVQGREDWAEFPQLVVLVVPVVLLYWLGLRAGRDRSAAGPSAVKQWQGVLLVTAVLLAPLTLFQFVDTIGGDVDSAWHRTWIFLVTAGLAAYASYSLGAVYQALLASLALVVAWLSLTDAILDDPSVSTFRVLLIVAAGALIAGSLALRRQGAAQAPELITAAGVAAVLAGLLGVFESLGPLTGGLFGGDADAGGQNVFWDLVLLGVSLALVGYGARVGARGPAYVGAFGLFVFTLLVGLELGALVDGDADGKLVGWPLLLVLGGGAALAAGFGLGQPRSGAGARDEPAIARPMQGAPPARPPDR